MYMDENMNKDFDLNNDDRVEDIPKDKMPENADFSGFSGIVLHVKGTKELKKGKLHTYFFCHDYTSSSRDSDNKSVILILILVADVGISYTPDTNSSLPGTSHTVGRMISPS